MRFMWTALSMGVVSFFATASGCGLSLEGTAPLANKSDAQTSDDDVFVPAEKDAGDANGENPSYAVGGTVTGLEAPNVVLENNGTDSVVVLPNAQGKATFEFQTKLKVGDPYSVTVRTQPENPEQVCEVTGGNGVVVASAPPSVAVHCATKSFTVSGTVTNLAGAGLTLSITGGEIVAVPPNSTSFTFAKGVLSGRDYAVIVAANPTSRWQTCTVTDNGPGKVTNADVSGVRINCETNSYAVGGSVYAPPGESVAIYNNSADPVIVSGMGLAIPVAFTFPTRVLSGATYSASAYNARGNVCQIENAAGQVTNANVGNIAIRCYGDPGQPQP